MLLDALVVESRAVAVELTLELLALACLFLPNLGQTDVVFARELANGVVGHFHGLLFG